jgi:tRNA-dihydrouridine synthase
MADAYEPDRQGAAYEFRKHLGWYAKGLPGSAELRKRLHAVVSLGEIEGIFEEYLRSRDRYGDDADQRDTERLEIIEV